MAVVSTHIIPCGIGMSVNDLLDEISLKVQDDHDLLLHLREIVAATVGAYISEISSYKFDLSTAKDFFAVYDYNTIPKINIEYIGLFYDFTSLEPRKPDKMII